MRHRPRMVLHAGSHKTGTTAIQQMLGASTDELSAQGVCWPKLDAGPRHHRLVLAIQDARWRGRLERRWLSHRVRRQSRGCHTTVLSSEKIYRMGYEFLEHEEQSTPAKRSRRVALLESLRALFADDFEVEVLLYLRRADEFAESLFKEIVFRKKYAGNLRFEAFLREQRALFDYGAQVAELERHLGPVHTQSYDDARRAGLVEHFCDRIGAKVPTRVPTDLRVRPSATNTAALFLDRLAEERSVSHRDRRRLFKFCLDGGLPDPEGRTRSLWPGREAFDAFLERYRAPELAPLFPPVDRTRIEFEPMGAAEFRRALTSFEDWCSQSRDAADPEPADEG